MTRATPKPGIGLGAAMLLRGNVNEAIKCFNAALKIKPDYTEARYNLKAALAAKSGRSIR